jgi:hypothetical protein
VALAFGGAPPSPDGSEVFLQASLLGRSLIYRSLAGGQAYPLFYDTLFADLRAVGACPSPWRAGFPCWWSPLGGSTSKGNRFGGRDRRVLPRCSTLDVVD